jgi:hypothetical protein
MIHGIHVVSILTSPAHRAMQISPGGRHLLHAIPISNLPWEGLQGKALMSDGRIGILAALACLETKPARQSQEGEYLFFTESITLTYLVFLMQVVKQRSFGNAV